MQGVGHQGVPYENKPIYGFLWTLALQWRIIANHSRKVQQTILDLSRPGLQSLSSDKANIKCTRSVSHATYLGQTFFSSLHCFHFVTFALTLHAANLYLAKWKTSSLQSGTDRQASANRVREKDYWKWLQRYVNLCQIETWLVSCSHTQAAQLINLAKLYIVVLVGLHYVSFSLSWAVFQLSVFIHLITVEHSVICILLGIKTGYSL